MLLRTFQLSKILCPSFCQPTWFFQRSFHLMTSIVPRLSSSIISTLTHNTSAPSILSKAITVPLINQVAGFKVKGRLKRRCKDCYFVMRQQRLYVICKTHPRHKQMSMKARDYKSWILTHATQSKIRPY